MWTQLQDSANYAYILPPVGSQQISYARFLELLSNRKIKRIILMDNATCAIVEVYFALHHRSAFKWWYVCTKDKSVSYLKKRLQEAL